MTSKVFIEMGVEQYLALRDFLINHKEDISISEDDMGDLYELYWDVLGEYPDA